MKMNQGKTRQSYHGNPHDISVKTGPEAFSKIL